MATIFANCVLSQHLFITVSSELRTAYCLLPTAYCSSLIPLRTSGQLGSTSIVIVRIRRPLYLLGRILLKLSHQPLDGLFQLRIAPLAPCLRIELDLDI